MRILKKIIIVLLILIALVLIIAVFLPSKRHIEASLTINAPAKAVYEQVINLKNWDKWSPFKEGDTAIKVVYSGAPKGVGSVMSWESKKEGNGVMTIMEAVNDKSIRTKIDFEGQGSSFSDWSFREDNNKSTQVTWAMDLDHLIYPVGRIMGLVMQSMLKKSFENGLSKLNNVSQNYLKQLSYFKTSEIKIKQTEKQYALVIKDSSKCDEIESLFGKLYMEIGQYMGKNKIESAGAPIARYFVWDEKANKCVVEAGFFIKNQVNGSGTIRCIEIPAEKAISAIHYGPYETLHNTHEAINDYIIRNKLNCKDIPIEIYITDPETQPDMTKWETEIDYPLK